MEHTPSFVDQLIASGALDQARQVIREVTSQRVHAVGGHREWALLAEKVGLLGLAEREFNLALRDDPKDVEALRHLVDLAEEKGALERAINLLVRLFELLPEPSTALRLYELYLEIGAEPKAEALARQCKELGIPLPRKVEVEEALPSVEPVIPPEADLVRFLSMFGGREDVFARQWFNPAKGEGGYAPVRQPLTPREIRAHLLGDVTVGVYPIRLDGTCLFAALDLDLQRSALEEARKSQSAARLIKEELQKVTASVRQVLEEQGLRPIVEDSGYKGRHFWFPLAAPEPAGTLVALGKAVLRLIQPLLGPHMTCEWFPKASKPGTKGLGNLIKLPLGLHRRTGRRSCFLDSEGKAIDRPFEFLRSHPLLGRQEIIAFLDRQRLEPPPEAESPAEAPPGEDESVAPQPLPPPPPWTAQDFEDAPVFKQLLEGCHVLRALVRQAIEERRLSYQQVIIIAHTFGYLPNGVVAANYLFDLVGHVPPHARLKSPLRGNPISCVKIRARIPEVTSRVPCNCIFPDVQDLYPTPLLHIRNANPSAAAPSALEEDLEHLVRKILVLQTRISTWKADLESLRRVVIARLKQEPQPYLTFADVDVRLEERDGVDSLVITPRERAS